VKEFDPKYLVGKTVKSVTYNGREFIMEFTDGTRLNAEGEYYYDCVVKVNDAELSVNAT
jgi:hypothetical protein